MAAGRKILIVDDDASLRQALAEQLELHEEFKVAQAGTPRPPMPRSTR